MSITKARLAAMMKINEDCMKRIEKLERQMALLMTGTLLMTGNLLEEKTKKEMTD